ncbi:MAG: ExeM/NucH family extracellular endonuclease, partial [Acidimicrobiales bacterium]
LLAMVTPAAAVPGEDSTVFINELHYDNAGTDTGEFVEVAGPAGTDLTGWSVVLYNGATGAVYGTNNLAGVLIDAGGGYGLAVVDLPVNGLQNGSPDGVALVNAGTVVQFLSYEGSFTATDGPAAGQTSTDIGVSEPSSTPIGQSLQLTGTGTTAVDFTWSGPAAESQGSVNNGQSFGAGGTAGQPFPLFEGFDIDDCTATGWQVVSVDSDQANSWSCNAGFSNADVNGFGDAAPADEWLISPALDMEAQTDETLDFRSLTRFTDVNYPQLEVLYSTDYDRAGDPSSATWTALNGFNLSPEDSDQFVASGPIDLSAIGGTNVSYAFRYTSSGTVAGAAANWRIDSVDFKVPGPTVVEAKIHDVQGPGTSTPLAGQPVEVQGTVTSLFEDNDALDGFFIQEEDLEVDGDPNTSEGLFVFCRGNCPAGLAVGDLVTVIGEPEEFFGMTQIDTGFGTGGSTTIVSSDNPLPSPVSVSLPASGPTDAEATFETVEGMVVRFPDRLVVSEYFQLARYGELVLTVDERPEQFTDANAPDVAGYATFLADLATRRIILDDNNNDQNDATTAPLDNEPYPWPVPGLSTNNFVRGGDSITGLVGVLHWSFAGQTGTDAWRIRRTDADYDFTADNPRSAAPDDVGGSLQVASFNVLNYFTTLDDGPGVCGPSGDLDCRGANSAAELMRQRDKIVAALAAMDADVVGLIEIENDDGTAAADLVAGLNAALGAGTYDYVDTGSIGTDAIKVAMIYKPGSVSEVGGFAILDSSVDPAFIDTKNRPVLIQTFEEMASGERFTVAVNHLKSKGSACDDVGDPDLDDGQANCNGTRTAAAKALADYLATDPTGSDDGDFLVIGDLNSYAMEDPITTLEGAGYTDLLEQFVGGDAYSFVFDGQLGYLDHALASAAMLSQVSGVTTWNINADEISLLDYNDDIQDPNEASFERESSALDIYDPDPYRSSDHDPVIVGLDLVDPATLCNGLPATILGTDGRDRLTGTSGDDVIVALGGNDFVNGRGGNDVICGGDGNDLIIAGSGDDVVFGQGGNDRINGNSGQDRLDGGDGDDRLIGNTGSDELSGGDGDDLLRGGLGDDSLDGGPDFDRLWGSFGTDTCTNGESNRSCEL